MCIRDRLPTSNFKGFITKGQPHFKNVNWGQGWNASQMGFWVWKYYCLLYTSHAANAKYAEGPHLYKIKDHYILLMAEGGSDYNHAVTARTAKSLWGPYVPCTVNPVLTHRHLGKRCV